MSDLSTPADDAPPLACVPGAIPAGERTAHFERTRQLFEGALERAELTDGYGFRFDPDRLADVVRFVEHERRCCPFLTFTIEQRPDGGPLWLRLTGPAGTREFLVAELDAVF